jgi:excisionase family DNA binding protein
MENYKVFTVKEVSIILRISTKTTYSMLKNKKLPFVRAGDKYLIPISALDTWLAKAEG